LKCSRKLLECYINGEKNQREGIYDTRSIMIGSNILKSNPFIGTLTNMVLFNYKPESSDLTQLETGKNLLPEKVEVIARSDNQSVDLNWLVTNNDGRKTTDFYIIVYENNVGPKLIKYKNRQCESFLLIVLFILHIFNTKTISKLIVILFTFIISYSTIYFEGYKSRVPDFLLTGLTKPWFLLKDNNNNRCFDNINGCSFGNQNKKKIFLIGDSNLGSIALDLKNKLNLKNINYKTYIIGGCTYITNFNRVNRITDKISSKCNDNYFQKIKRDIGTNSIVILGGRMPQWLSGRLFDNMEGGVEIVNGTNEWGGKFVSLNKGLEFDQGFKNSTLELIENNNNVILVYPLPEVGWNVPKKIIELSETKNLIKLKKITLNDESKIPILTTNFDVYLKRSSKSFELYNSIVDKRVFRVYPHEILCNQSIKERCIANDQNYTYYSDDDHPSEVTSNLIAEKIFEKIKLIVTNEKN